MRTAAAPPRLVTIGALSRRAVAVLLTALATRVALGQELHGTSDTFAGEGIAIAWGILRGPSEAETLVVVRVAADPGRYAALAADGVDPFTRERKTIVARHPLAGSDNLRIRRSHFADFPRTELRLYPGGAPGISSSPRTVYYLGVPDTTPEFAKEAALEAYLDERIAKLRPRAGP